MTPQDLPPLGISVDFLLFSLTLAGIAIEWRRFLERFGPYHDHDDVDPGRGGQPGA